MRRYGAELVFEGRDDFGAIEVVEDGIERSLHFGTSAKQSSMSIAEPLHLQLTYTQAMVAPLLFQNEPKRVLLIGLGGGSLAKFFLQHFPGCRVDAVELRAEVAKVAQRFFHLPDTPRLNIVIDDAADFVANASVDEFSNYDMILVDAFVAMGISHSVCALSFFEGCAQRLARDGMVAVNLWARDRVALTEIVESMSDGLHRPVWRLPVQDKDNVIALSGRPSQARAPRSLSDRARLLHERYDIGFPNLLKLLRRHNPALL